LYSENLQSDFDRRIELRVDLTVARRLNKRKKVALFFEIWKRTRERRVVSLDTARFRT